MHNFPEGTRRNSPVEALRDSPMETLPMETLRERAQPRRPALRTVGQHPTRLARQLSRLLGGKATRFSRGDAGRTLRFSLLVLMMLGLVWLANAMVTVAQPPAPIYLSQTQSPPRSPSAATRRLRPWEVSAVIYELFPELPQENQYEPIAGADAAIDNTLVSRLIRYHLYVKNRPSTYRLDWKLTLADYLGANEIMRESQYPGYDTLRTNPLAGDRAAITQLSRQDRDRLVELLVRAFNPLYDRLVLEAATHKRGQRPEPTPSPTPATPTLPPLPRPGDAQLLAP